MRRVPEARGAPRLYALADPKFRFFSDAVFNVFNWFANTGRSSFGQINADDLLAIPADELVHRVQPGEGVAGVIKTAFIDRLQILVDVTPCQRRTAKNHWHGDAALVH